MKAEWRYVFRRSPDAEAFLNSLVLKREQGSSLGSTYPAAYTHTCFSEAQCAELHRLMGKHERLEVQQRSYFQGDLFDVDFGMKTFKEPIVQWCPSVVYSETFGQVIPPIQPWGLTMEGRILLPADLEPVIERYVTGIVRVAVGSRMDTRFHLYRIEYEGYDLHYEYEARQPLVVDCARAPKSDLMSLGNGVLLCSSRFAAVLKKYWDGMVHAKFQPVRCLNVSAFLRKRNLTKIEVTGNKDARQILSDIRALGASLGCEFPKEYLGWVVELGGLLPSGWLSPLGGTSSEVALTAKQEHEESDPAMSAELVPLFSLGDGSYVCLEKGTGRFMSWEHASGEIECIGEPGGFMVLVDRLSG
jgi:hypothetical protein